MHLEMRDEPPLDDESLLMLHMGAGNVTQTTRTVFDNHDAWIPVIGRGRFTLSVYAARTEQARSAILSAMPHKQYGTASVATIRTSGVQVVATNTVGVPESLLAVQSLHYSLLVREGFDSPAAERDEADRSAVVAGLEHEVGRVLALFSPRVPNPLSRSMPRRD